MNGNLLPAEIRDCHPELYDAIAARGREFEYRSPGPGIKPLADNQCFANAQEVARQAGVLYAEGFALHGDCWRQHGWNVNPDGEALDFTLPEAAERYIGVTMSYREAMAAVRAHPGDCRVFVPPRVRSYIKGTNYKRAADSAVAFRPGRMTKVIDPDAERRRTSRRA